MKTWKEIWDEVVAPYLLGCGLFIAIAMTLTVFIRFLVWWVNFWFY